MEVPNLNELGVGFGFERGFFAGSCRDTTQTLFIFGSLYLIGRA
jgi:hypothetical protein